MGSVASLARRPDYAKVVMLAIRQHVQDRVSMGREPDLRTVCRILNEALDDANGGMVLLGLSEILCAYCTGVTLDLQSWVPPRL